MHSESRLITGTNLGVRYKMPFSGRAIRQNSSSHHWAFRGLNITLEQGEILGVVGKNGSGKTTLCRVLSGILEPDEGVLNSRYGVMPVFGFGVGFHPELTGVQNAYLYGAYFGRGKQFIEEVLSKISDFAQLGHFFEQPIRTYSTGMKARLGFALAIAMEPEVLILDEAFAAGDSEFRKRSESLLSDAMQLCKGVILVSHSERIIEKLATRKLQLNAT